MQENANEGFDRVVFTDLALSDVKFTFVDYTDDVGPYVPQRGEALRITWQDGSSTKELRIANMGANVEEFEFADGSTIGAVDADFQTEVRDKITGTAGDDLIVGTAESGYIYGGEGNDSIDAGGSSGAWQYLYGEEGNDTYTYGTDSELVLIHEHQDDGLEGADDRLIFSDLLLQDFDFSFKDYGSTHTWGEAIVANWNKDGKSGKVLISQKGEGIEEFEFSDGSVLSEIIVDYALANHTNENANTVSDLTERDKLKGTDGDNLIRGTDVSEYILGLGGNDTLDAGEGSSAWQYLVGGAGDDTYEYAKEGRKVYITDNGDDDDVNNRLVLSDLDFADVIFSEIPYSSHVALRILWNDGSGSGEVRIADGASDFDQIEFADGIIHSGDYLFDLA